MLAQGHPDWFFVIYFGSGKTLLLKNNRKNIFFLKNEDV